MVDISISKSYLAMVFCLVFCYEGTILLFGNGFWGTQVFLIFLIMYLLHEPAHAFMGLWYGIDVLEIHLDWSNKKDSDSGSYTKFASIDDKDPKKIEIEGMIFGAGFAVDCAAIIYIIGICTLWGFMELSFASIVPILFAFAMTIIFIYGLGRKDSDFQKLKEKLPEKVGALE